MFILIETKYLKKCYKLSLICAKFHAALNNFYLRTSFIFLKIVPSNFINKRKIRNFISDSIKIFFYLVLNSICYRVTHSKGSQNPTHNLNIRNKVRLGRAKSCFFDQFPLLRHRYFSRAECATCK